MGRYRLTVYPPGTNDSERRTFAVALLIAVVLADLRSIAALVAVGVGYLAGMVVSRALSRRLRDELRVVSAIETSLGGENRLVDEPELFRRSRARLEELDAASRTGRLSPVEFEAGWGAVYRSLDERTAGIGRPLSALCR